MVTFVVSSSGDDSGTAGSEVIPSSTTRAVVPTPETPAFLEFVSVDGAVVLRWEHTGGSDISFHVQDDGGSRVATGLAESEYVFPMAPDFGVCFSVAAEAAVEGISRPLSRWVEACR